MSPIGWKAKSRCKVAKTDLGVARPENLAEDPREVTVVAADNAIGSVRLGDRLLERRG
jgi:hypothetical protein